MRRSLLAGATALLLAGVGVPAAPAATSPARPVLAAPAAIVLDQQSGDVVFSKAPDRRRRMASTTKLMTVLLTLERAPLSARPRAIRYVAQPAESVLGLRAGERMTVADLLRAVLLASANDAAATLAHSVGRTPARFVTLMNRRARQLGLKHTHYANPIGLDAAGNYSTPRDLATLAVVVRRSAFARAVMNRAGAVLTSGDHTRRIANRNTLVRDVPWMSGVKTGHTQQAGYVLVGSGARRGVELVSVVMGDPSEAARNIDTLTALNFGFSRYHRVTAARAGNVAAQVPVRDQDVTVGVVPSRTLRIVARPDQRVTAAIRGLPSSVEGPLRRGETVATLVVRRAGRLVGSVPLVSATAIGGASFWQRNPWIVTVLEALVLMAIIGGLVGSLTRANRRRTRRRSAGSPTA